MKIIDQIHEFKTLIKFIYMYKSKILSSCSHNYKMVVKVLVLKKNTSFLKIF